MESSQNSAWRFCLQGVHQYDPLQMLLLRPVSLFSWLIEFDLYLFALRMLKAFFSLDRRYLSNQL